MIKVFLSFSSEDREIALQVVALLLDGAGDCEVFCSASPNSIKNGHFFITEILTKLKAANLTVSLLSPHYFESQFCVAELGTAVVQQLSGEANFRSYLIPPTRFGDLAGVLMGVQSDNLNETAALDELCKSLGSDPTTDKWIKARDIFRRKVQPIADRREVEELLKKIVIHDFRAEPTDDPDIQFKSKIRVQFKNDTGAKIEVKDPIWSAGSEDVPQQSPPQDVGAVQVEGSNGWHVGHWQPPNVSVIVAPGAVFRLWVGLHQFFNADELRRRHEAGRLGTLKIPVKINGHELDWKKRI